MKGSIYHNRVSRSMTAQEINPLKLRGVAGPSDQFESSPKITSDLLMTGSNELRDKYKHSAYTSHTVSNHTIQGTDEE